MANEEQRVDPREVVSAEQISTQLAVLARRESELTLALNALIADRNHIDNALLHLRELGSEVERISSEVDGHNAVPDPPFGSSSRGLGLQNGDGPSSIHQPGHDALDAFSTSGDLLGAATTAAHEDGLVERVRRVWETSERVGGKVRRLDNEIGRVREAADIVADVFELKNALQTLSASIDKRDWELASRACKRAMSVRTAVIDGGFANAVVPTAAQSLPPRQLLNELRNVLLHTFREEFDAAAARKDQQGVSRFFRLWPGIEAEEEGLEAYGDFVVGLVKSRSTGSTKPSSPLHYVNQLTSLLESIAHIIDQHQPLVDRYYGVGRMRRVVGRLIGESDRVVRGLVEGWEEERRVGRLISETKQSRFALLANPSLLPPLYPSLASSSAPQISLGSIATATTSHLPNLSTASNLLQNYAPGAKRPQATSQNQYQQSAAQQQQQLQQQTQQLDRTSTPGFAAEDEPSGPDSRDVDQVLGELVALSGRWALFRRFVMSRLSDDEAETPDGSASTGVPSAAGDGPSSPAQLNGEILDQSGSQRAIGNLLKVYYEPLEIWFLRSSIEKAHRLDTPDTSNRPHLSSVLDDTFYLLKLVLQRLLGCGSLSTLRSLRARTTEIIENDYITVMRRKMEAVYSGNGGGSDAREKARDQRAAFIIYLNDLDVSADYMERLIDDMLVNMPQVFPEEEDHAVRSELSLLRDMSSRFRAASKTGLEQLFNQITRPRLRGLLDDCYKDLSYVLDDDAFAEAEEQDLVRKRFVRGWEGLVDGYKEAFTDHNYQAFFALTVETLVRPWEKMIMNMRFSELGAVRYERDIRGISNYLSGQSSLGGAREKFTRLQQIGMVLSLDAEEDPEDFYADSGIPWRLSKAEYGAILEQRQ